MTPRCGETEKFPPISYAILIIMTYFALSNKT